MCQGLATTSSHLSPSSAAFQTTSWHLRAAFQGKYFAVQWFIWIQKHSTALNRIIRYKIWFVRHKSAMGSTDSIQQIRKIMSDSELHWYCQKEIRSLLYQFPFEYVTLEDKQVSGYSSKRALYEFCFCQPWYLFMCCWCFLEISTHLFLPYLSNLHTRNG